MWFPGDGGGNLVRDWQSGWWFAGFLGFLTYVACGQDGEAGGGGDGLRRAAVIELEQPAEALRLRDVAGAVEPPVIAVQRQCGLNVSGL